MRVSLSYTHLPTSALPEIAGDSVLYFNPENIDEISDAISKLIDSPENSERRESIIEKALDWVNQYSWERTARETLDYISSCMENKIQ